MSKGRWKKTRDNVTEAVILARMILARDDYEIKKRSELVRALMAKQGISYATANRAVNLAACRFQRVFKRFSK